MAGDTYESREAKVWNKRIPAFLSVPLCLRGSFFWLIVLQASNYNGGIPSSHRLQARHAARYSQILGVVHQCDLSRGSFEIRKQDRRRQIQMKDSGLACLPRAADAIAI